VIAGAARRAFTDVRLAASTTNAMKRNEIAYDMAQNLVPEPVLANSQARGTGKAAAILGGVNDP